MTFIWNAREYRNEREFDCTQEEGVGSEDQSPGAYERRDALKAGEAATLERQDATEVVSLLWLAPSYVEHEATSQERVKKFHLCIPTVRNTRSITQMMQTNWNVMDSSRNRKVMLRSRVR